MGNFAQHKQSEGAKSLLDAAAQMGRRPYGAWPRPFQAGVKNGENCSGPEARMPGQAKLTALRTCTTFGNVNPGLNAGAISFRASGPDGQQLHRRGDYHRSAKTGIWR